MHPLFLESLSAAEQRRRHDAAVTARNARRARRLARSGRVVDQRRTATVIDLTEDCADGPPFQARMPA